MGASAMMRIVSLASALVAASSIAAAQPLDLLTVQISGIVGGQSVPGVGAPARDQPPRTGTSRLRGRVVAADTGQPLRKAIVRLNSPEIREGRSTSTDANGLYEFRDLPGGRYTLLANKGSYVSLSFGQTRPFEGARPIELAENQTIDRLDFRLPRGAIITGRVIDEFGEPVADASVSPLRQQYTPNGRRMMPQGRMAMTNDVGEFRLFGLSPGQYVLSAVLRNAPMAMPSGDTDERTGYAPTYYPGTDDPEAAQRIILTVGQVVSDLQISLVLTQTARLSGIALDGAGRRLSMGMVMVQARSIGPFFGPMTGSIRPDGTFFIAGVAPGDYTLRATGPGMNGPGDASVARVTVAGQDISGIQLVPRLPVTATGRIVVDGGALAGSTGLRPETIQVMMQPQSPEDMMGAFLGPPAHARDDFSFEVKALPGKVNVRAFTQDATWILKSVRLRGVDITDSGVEVTPDADLSELEIVLTSRRSEVSGLVTNARGEKVSNYTVIFFPRDRARWQPPSRYIATARPDQDGRFKLRTLPPADYQAVAVEYVENGQWTDPDFLESVQQAATHVAIGEGETKTLDLKLFESR
jgi:Carboxypeptidase regulatory-like domain